MTGYVIPIMVRHPLLMEHPKGDVQCFDTLEEAMAARYLWRPSSLPMVLRSLGCMFLHADYAGDHSQSKPTKMLMRNPRKGDLKVIKRAAL